MTAAAATPRDQDITFDWAAGRVRGVAERRKVDLPTQPGLLDTLSVQVALMRDLFAGDVPAKFVLVDKDRIKDYDYAWQGHEQVETDAGKYETVIYTQPAARFGQRHLVLVRAGAGLPAAQGRAARRRRRAMVHASGEREALTLRAAHGQALGRVTPFWPWYLPPRSL